MKLRGLVVFLALSFTSVTSYDQSACKQFSRVCRTNERIAAPGSSVLLPCIVRTSNSTEVSWTRSPDSTLIRLTSKGRIQFLDPRNGRVKAFPNQASERNFSIRIDERDASNPGCYLCDWGEGCIQVELTAEEGTEDKKFLIYICVIVATLLLLGAGSYFCFKWIQNRKKATLEISVSSACTSGNNVPPPQPDRGPENQHHKGPYNDGLVYENDDQDPAYLRDGHSGKQSTLPAANPDPAQPSQSTSGIYRNTHQFKFVRMEGQSTKRRFHTELFNRLRQASLSRHHYVNQGEIKRQQAAQAENQSRGLGKRRAKDDHEYKNPIYNRSTDNLNQL
ncbi:uncharacterized protein LOC121516063 isoform X2 [Cheilinus undulatus]|uniref:uncharacterized protein LOC121516063 isoform X2 n=1 Tax=Cheilinus undulatus TaxID=241271 RepID=UPI001BD2C2AF|nr:uncharacterized protein LOC121516063 isoform X2 [Cheilinus undulatus]